MTTPSTPSEPPSPGGQPAGAYPPAGTPTPPAPPTPPAAYPPPPAPPTPPAAYPPPPAPPVATAGDPYAAPNVPNAAAPGWGAGGTSKMAFDPKTINPLDWGILGAGFLAFIFSLFGFYTAKATVTFGTIKRSSSNSASAWHEIFTGGFFGWWAMVFALAGAVVLALHLFVPTLRIPVPLTPRQLVLGLFAVGALFEILAIFVHPDFGSASGPGFSYSFGHGFSFWISLIVILAGAVLAFLRLQQVGEKLPWEKRS